MEGINSMGIVPDAYDQNRNTLLVVCGGLGGGWTITVSTRVSTFGGAHAGQYGPGSLA